MPCDIEFKIIVTLLLTIYQLVYFTLHPARDKITVFRIIIFVYKKEYQYASNNK